MFQAQRGYAPKLSVVLVGEDPASKIYVGRKERAAKDLGFDHETRVFAAATPPETVRSQIAEMCEDPRLHGILMQRPLPASFLENEFVSWISPSKDVDCFHPENAGLLYLDRPRFLPCTPAGVIRLLDHYRVKIPGVRACVIGRSTIVGKPMAQLLLARDATVLHCHSKTKDLKEAARSCDLVVVAAGKEGLIDSSYLKPGAVVIDVGIHRRADGKIVGDVDFEGASNVASAITPVPGGVGPMTIAMLLENTMKSAEMSEET